MWTSKGTVGITNLSVWFPLTRYPGGSLFEIRGGESFYYYYYYYFLFSPNPVRLFDTNRDLSLLPLLPTSTFRDSSEVRSIH